MNVDEGTVVVESASVKLFVGQLLNDVRQVQLDGAEAMWELALPDGNARPFLRVWIQGVVVELMDGVGVTLDDGSGTIFVHLKQYLKRYGTEVCSSDRRRVPVAIMLRGAPIYRNAAPLQLGAYLMVHGPLKMDGGGLPFIKALKVQNYSGQPDMEAAWYVDVVRVHSEVYTQPPDEHTAPAAAAAAAAPPQVDVDTHAWGGEDGYDSPELL